ncbi:CotD family spore coat protein [Peribacillus frigoritolerans]|uniref:CotD family spore coat protein n=1 Tax=Peribacillus frigoritolerans TaxID=450367 RepID=UPI001F4FEE4D|nr:CotD family spore coat protein [Peribacillus frigoritolerans]MCK2016485.1 spore coat protein [Peribacillus frigoritolerans]
MYFRNCGGNKPHVMGASNNVMGTSNVMGASNNVMGAHNNVMGAHNNNVMGASTGKKNSNVMGASDVMGAYSPMAVSPAQYGPSAVSPAQYGPTQTSPSQVAPAQVSPTQQYVNTNVSNTVIPVVHPSHTTNVNKHVNTFKHYFPHTQSVVNECYNQHLICGRPPQNPCCPPRHFGY